MDEQGLKALRERNAENSLRQGKSLRPPQTLPYRALARTCEGCGELLTTPDHLIRRAAGRTSHCSTCHSKRCTAYNRTTYREKRLRYNRTYQDESLDTASNRYKQWTGPELEVVGRSGLTTRQAAEMLGRTVSAVARQRQLLRSDPKKINVAGLPDSVAGRVSS